MSPELLEEVFAAVRELHPSNLARLHLILDNGLATPPQLNPLILKMPQKDQRERLEKFALAWAKEGQYSGAQLLGAFKSAEFAHKSQTKAEICWSGPVGTVQGFRSTAEAYRELISGARESALIISFAVGEVEHLRASLESAVGRNVRIQMVLEDFNVFTQECWRSKFFAFGATVLAKSEIYIWPTSKRRKFEGRVFGSMHVKCLIIDYTTMLLTSANWSGAAMQDNMELGIKVRDRDLVRSVVNHVSHLMATQILVPLPDIEPFM